MYREWDKIEIMGYTYSLLQSSGCWYYLNNRGWPNDLVFNELWVDKYNYCWLPDETSWIFPYHPTLEHINQTIDKLLWKNTVNIYDLIW